MLRPAVFVIIVKSLQILQSDLNCFKTREWGTHECVRQLKNTVACMYLKCVQQKTERSNQLKHKSEIQYIFIIPTFIFSIFITPIHFKSSELDRLDFLQPRRAEL